MKTIIDQPLRTVLDTLASSAPTPGGGSVAAISAALAAGLLTMVCDLTIGKKSYATFDAEARSLRQRAEAARNQLQDLAQADMDAFEPLAAAYRLPKQTDVERAVRDAALQSALHDATLVPLVIAEVAARLPAIAAPLAERGSKLAVSDVGIAMYLARAAVPAALLNVTINLEQLADTALIEDVRRRAALVTDDLDTTIDAVLAHVAARLRKS
jgi:formiminotetrahydrofolate cyclodeaminase